MKRITILMVAAILLLIGIPVAKMASQETLEIKVRKLERISTGSGENLEHKYIVSSEILGEDFEVFENTDSWLFLKFNSADFQNQLEVGKTYKVKIIGWRIPLLSTYRNIVKIYPQQSINEKTDQTTSTSRGNYWFHLF